MKTKNNVIIILSIVVIMSILSSCTPKYNVSFKDSDGTVIETVSVKEGELPINTIIPKKAADDIYNYIFDGWDKEITAANSDVEYTATFKKVPGTVKWFEDKKIVFLGDSITNCHGIQDREVNGYPYLVCSALGAEIVNMGTDSRTFCDGGHRESCLNDIKDIPVDADIVIVALGVNDWDQGVKDGYFYLNRRIYSPDATYYDLGEAGTDDTSTIRGAVAAYCERIAEHLDKDDARIYFMTPIMCAGNYSVGITARRDFDPSLKNIHGFTQEDMNAVIKDVCSQYGIQVIDTYNNSGIDETNAADYYFDGIHPNIAGHRKMADEVVRALKADILVPIE